MLNSKNENLKGEDASPSAAAGSEELAGEVTKLVCYVLSCRLKNTEDWMEGLAEQINSLCEEFEDPGRFRFNGDTLVPVKKP